MTTNVKFCLSYDPLKLDFIALKMDNISEEKAFLTQIMSMKLHVRTKVLLHMWSYNIYGTTLSSE